MMENIFYSTLLFVAALVSAAVAAVIWPRRTAPGSLPLVIYLLAMTWWSGTYALHWTGVYRPSPFFWLDITYLGVVIVVGAFLAFVLQFTHRAHWLTRPVLLILVFEPVLTFILLWTDSAHGLFFAGQRTPTDSTIYAGGPWFWTNIVYSYVLSIMSIWLLLKTFLTTHSLLYRQQVGLVLFSALIPFGANIISLVKLNPWPDLDLTPIAFSVSGVVIGLSLFRYRFLEVVPVARDILVENMNDGVIVVDELDRVIDINPAGAHLLGVEISTAVGQWANTLVPGWVTLQTASAAGGRTEQEICLPHKAPVYLDARLIRLRGYQYGRGKLIILRDITERKQLETEREELIETLQSTLAQVNTLEGLLPICANCKKIRDEQGDWHQIELYIHEHTEADFSHGICPDCKMKLYPGLYSDDD